MKRLDWLFQEEKSVPFFLNMPIDNQFFIQGENGSLSNPVIRFYTWSSPTISIGFHQTLNDFNSSQLNRDHIPVVKRLSGGRAVAHFNDLTYTVIVPAYLKINHRQLYKEVHEAFYTTFKKISIHSEFEKNNAGLLKRKEIPKTCFSSAARWELKINGGKLVGSAQKIGRQGTILQHGSIPIGKEYLKIVDYLLECEEKKARLSAYLNKNTSYLKAVKPDMNYEDLIDGLMESFKEKFLIKTFIPKKTKDII